MKHKFTKFIIENYNSLTKNQQKCAQMLQSNTYRLDKN